MAPRTKIWLTSPLGQTLAIFDLMPKVLLLMGSDKKEYRASSIDSLVRSAFGWRFPVADLRFWVVGAVVPGPQPVLLERDPAQRINKLEQGDWQVAFNYATVDSQRPARLTVNGMMPRSDWSSIRSRLSSHESGGCLPGARETESDAACDRTSQ